MVVTDAQGVIVRANQAYGELCGIPREALIGQHFTHMLPPKDREQAARYHQEFIAGKQGNISEWRGQRSNGSIFDVYATSSLLVGEDGQRFRVTTIMDVTQQKRTIEALRISEERFRNLFDQSPDAIFVQALDGTILDVNQMACHLHGTTREMLIGKNAIDGTFTPPERHDYLRRALPDIISGEINFFEAICRTQAGRDIPVEIRASRITHLGEPALLLHVRDISERKRADERLFTLEHHDMLTGLPNRKHFRSLVEHSLSRIGSRDSLPFAVILLDLDYFKAINESLGHRVGDEVLILVSQRLRQSVRPEDVVARIGSDEFAILLQYVTDTYDATLIAERLRKLLSAPFFLNNQKVMVTASMGIALSTSDYVQVDDLIRNAGMAMDYAREQERVSIMVFDNSMHQHAQERQQIRRELPRAIECNELCLHYQPIIDLQSGQLAGFEALLRWQHPERGLLSPGAFVPIAEETDLIIALGQWVLREVCRQARQWTEELRLMRTFSIYINLSAKEFLDPRLIQNLQAVLSEGSLGMFQLKLEITESVMMDDADTTIEMLWSLRNLGFRLCIDDFGTGYSSLRYLQRFPVQTVKIDHSFISHFESDHESVLIVKAIVLMAQALNMDVIAEWIETPDQLAQLEAMGCTYGQGHLFSRPIDAAAATRWLEG